MVDDDKRKRKAAKPGKKIETMRLTPAKPEVSDLIGQRLRNYYEEVANEPVPDRFLDLLNQLEAASAAKKPN
jgi:Anti-sigma factor NepR